MATYVEIAANLPPARCSIVARALVDTRSAFSHFRAGPPVLALYAALIGIATQMRDGEGNLDAHGRAIFESMVKPLSETNWWACMKAVLTIPATSPRRACALKALEDSIHLLPAAKRAACEKQLAGAAAPAAPPPGTPPDA